jgi:DNA segregation ATPase FtsK/SpoIIIE-like protein
VGVLAEQAEPMAAYLRAREVRVLRDRSNARYALVSVVWCDPLSGGPALPWPFLSALRTSLWDAIAVGVDESGEVVSIRIVWRHVLLGGEPGAGKSVAIMLLVAWAALDPSVRLWLFDGKLVELATWRRCAERFVGPDLAEANAALRELRAEMDRRYQWLLSAGKRQVGPDDGMGLHLVVIDELAWYLTGEKKQAQEFEAQLRDLVARGRAAGIIVVAATQKPAHDTVPTSIRDLFGFRWALRCSTREASDTILGSGWGSQGYSAASIDAADRGVGYLRHEGGTPVRIKGFFLSDDDLAALAARAEALRKPEAPGLRLVEAE